MEKVHGYTKLAVGVVFIVACVIAQAAVFIMPSGPSKKEGAGLQPNVNAQGQINRDFLNTFQALEITNIDVSCMKKDTNSHGTLVVAYKSNFGGVYNLPATQECQTEGLLVSLWLSTYRGRSEWTVTSRYPYAYPIIKEIVDKVVADFKARAEKL